MRIFLLQVIDKRFLDHLDLSYAVNTDKYEKHRALHLGKASESATLGYNFGTMFLLLC
jgi:hypothetical protein